MKLKTRIRRALTYWRWRLSHPTAPYEQYYVHRVMSKIRSGHGHPAIGPKARPLRNEAELLEFLLKHGLKPGDLTIDYGCGSLRLASNQANTGAWTWRRTSSTSVAPISRRS